MLKHKTGENNSFVSLAPNWVKNEKKQKLIMRLQIIIVIDLSQTRREDDTYSFNTHSSLNSDKFSSVKEFP